MTPKYATCVAEALISVVTVAGLKASGTTLGDLREGFSAEQNDLPDELYDSMPDATRQAFGAAVQQCGFGPAIAPDLVRNIQGSRSSADIAPHAKCVADALSSSQHQRLVAAMRLVAYLRHREALELSGIVIGCIDWGATMQTGVGVELSRVERACINRNAQNEPAFQRALAESMMGNDDPYDQFIERLQHACLTPAHAHAAQSSNSSG
jgi:hypothetical protein